jgi:hypothetical protein
MVLIEGIVRCQARLKATNELAENSRTARFLLGESASITAEANEAQITVLAHHLIDHPGIWH